MSDVITFGSATWDIFFNPEDFQVVEDEQFVTGKGLCFALGSKVDVDEVFFSIGGGGTNTAATFAKQNFEVAYCGSIGKDFAGEEIIEILRDKDIDTDYIKKIEAKITNRSVIIPSDRGERTILAYRGAAEYLTEVDIPWEELEAEYFYLAPLSGNLSEITEKIVNFANQNNIKVAFNPGNDQLEFGQEKLGRILEKVDILILNQEEASKLTQIPYQKEKAIFEKIDEFCPGIAIMTKGDRGVVVSDGSHLYRAGILESEVVDKTGAGDSFGSGFVSGFMRKREIEYSIQLGVANATACLKKRGAKNGLLSCEEDFQKVKVDKKSL